MEPSEAHMKARAAEKQSAIDRLDQAMGFLKMQTREIEKWEIVCMAEGISCLYHGIYRLAYSQAFQALADKQHHEAPAKLPDYNFTLQQLIDALDKVRHMPVEPYPIFGKIILTDVA